MSAARVLIDLIKTMARFFIRRCHLHDEVALFIGTAIVVVLAITVVTPRIGATATIGLLIAGQLAMGVLIDRYGWFGVEQVPLNWPRIVGVLLLAVGALLALRR